MKKLLAVIFAFQLMLAPMPKAHAGGIAGMANQLRGIAIASVGATVITSCKLGMLSTSLKVFMAASLVYLAGEMAAGKSQKKEIESENQKVDESKGGRGGETQLASLEAQLKDKEEKKKVADKRGMFTAASMALMTAAAVLAVMEIPRQYPPFVPPALLPPLACIGPEAVLKGNITATGIAAGFTFLSGGGMIPSLLAGIGVYTGVVGGLVTVMNKAEGRAAVFGALAAFTGLAMMDAKSESSKLAGEIKQLKEMIAQFKKETGDPGDQKEDTTGGASGGTDVGIIAGSTSGSSSGSTSGAGPGGTITALPGGAQNVSGSRVCITSAGPSSNCANALRVPSVNLNGLGAGPELQQVASQGVELGNSIASGNAGAEANISAAAIGSSAGKINDELKKQLAKQNASLRAQGKKAIDFDKEVADTVKSFNSAAQAEAAKSGQLAALGNTDAVLDPNAAAKAAQDINAASTGSALAVPTSNGAAAAAVDPALNANTALNSEDIKKLEASAKDALGNNLNEYESTEEDISKNKEDSLWKQVSNRYLLNYQRFFERNKGPAPAQ